MGEQITAKNQSKLISVAWADGLNCYSFAAKCAAPTGAGPIACHPGAAGGRPVSQANITQITLHQACVADGFIDASGGVLGSNYKFANPPVCPPNHYLVAVFLDNRNSYHFARQLDDGSRNRRQWVHKPSAVQDAHNMQGGWILGEDPSNVPWAPFQFVSYLLAPTVGVAVQKGTF